VPQVRQESIWPVGFGIAGCQGLEPGLLKVACFDVGALHVGRGCLCGLNNGLQLGISSSDLSLGVVVVLVVLVVTHSNEGGAFRVSLLHLLYCGLGLFGSSIGGRILGRQGVSWCGSGTGSGTWGPAAGCEGIGGAAIEVPLHFENGFGAEMAFVGQIQAQLEGTVQIVDVTGRYAILLIFAGNAPL
jgi:hypothetical protein